MSATALAVDTSLSFPGFTHGNDILSLRASPQFAFGMPRFTKGLTSPALLPVFEFPATETSSQLLEAPTKRQKKYRKGLHHRKDAVSNVHRAHRNAQFFPPVPPLPTDLASIRPPELQSPTRRKRPSIFRLEDVPEHTIVRPSVAPSSSLLPVTPRSTTTSIHSICPTLEADDSPSRASLSTGRTSAMSDFISPDLPRAHGISTQDDCKLRASKEPVQGLGISIVDDSQFWPGARATATDLEEVRHPWDNDNDNDDDDDEFWGCIGSRKGSLVLNYSYPRPSWSLASSPSPLLLSAATSAQASTQIQAIPDWANAVDEETRVEDVRQGDNLHDVLNVEDGLQTLAGGWLRAI